MGEVRGVARLMGAIVAASLVVLGGSVAAAASTSHVVGGSTGWTIPPNTSFYSVWSSAETFTAGDTLVFNFPSGIHNVIKVPKSSYDACTSTTKLGSTLKTPPATVTLTPGDHYYICGVIGHCSAGQKLSISVVASSSASSPAPPPTAPTVASAPGGSPTTTASPPGGSSTTTASPPGGASTLGPSGINASSSTPLLRTKAATVAFMLLLTVSLLL